MKQILKYISILSVALLCANCESDIEQTVYDPSTVTASVLEGVDARYDLEQDDADTELTLKWSQPDMGYSASLENYVEMDLEGQDGSNKIILTTSNGAGEYKMTRRDLNQNIKKVVQAYGLTYDNVESATYDVKFSVVSSISSDVSPIVSNILSSQVKNYIPIHIAPANLVSVPVLVPEAGLELKVENEDATALTLTWDKYTMDKGTEAQVNRIMIDLYGRNSRAIEVVLLGNVNEYSITTGALNNKIKALKESYDAEGSFVAGDTYKVDIYIISQMEAPSDGKPAEFEKTLTGIENIPITTYKMKEPSVDPETTAAIYLHGTYTGWLNDKRSPKLYLSGATYTGMIYFDGKASEGWKVNDIEGDGSWSGSDETVAEKSPMILDGGAGDIKNYSKMCYDFEYDKVAKQITILNSYNSWGVKIGEDNDVEFKPESGVDSNGGTTHYLTVTVDLLANEEWYIRADKDDIHTLKFAGAKLLCEPVGDCIKADDNNNFKVKSGGSYTIKWYYNRAEPVVVIFKN